MNSQSSFAFYSIKQLRDKLASKEISVAEVLALSRQRCMQYDSELGSLLELFDPISPVSQTGKLAGIPGVIKDNICQQGRITSCASRILENFQAPYDATAVSKLKQEGALLLGRANCDEFAMGSSTETSAFKKTCNPWDLSRVPGGSSGGPAAAVAAGLVPWALGSETGGSVRQPAALCGIVGSKPTYGLVSRYGLVAYASSIDQIGIFTRTIYDNALVMSVIAGKDDNDSTTLKNHTVPDYTQSLNGKIRPGIKIGVIDNALNAEGIDEEVRSALQEALEELKRLGAEIRYISLPTLDYSAAVYFMISRAEAASNLSRFDGVRYGMRDKEAQTLAEMYGNTRSAGFGAEVKRRILIGNYVLSAGHADQYYTSARIVQGLMRQELLASFKEVDLLFAPVSPAGAFKFGAFDNDRLQMDLQDYFTAFVNLTGVPAVSVPCGFTQNQLPIGFQLIGPDLSEELIFQTAHAYEQATPWHMMHPPRYNK